MKYKELLIFIVIILFSSCNKPIAVFHWKKNGVRFVSKKKPNGENAMGYPNHGFVSKVICFDELCRNKAKWMESQKHMAIKVKDYSKKRRIPLTTPASPSNDSIVQKSIVAFESITGNNLTKTEPTTKEEVMKTTAINSEIQKEKVFIFKNLNFEIGTSVIIRSDKSSLDSVIQIMNKNASLKIQITGHTDNSGSEKGNMKLSWDRAEAVSYHLFLSGIEKERIRINGLGSRKPLTQSNSIEDKKKNRRVEFYFF